MRLDQYLHDNNLAESREKAKALVMAGIVYVDDAKAEKAGQKVQDGAIVEVRGSGLRYVSRGGLKLEKALQSFSASPGGKICMDIGASTGGFTDCMLQNGAEKVYAVDVGYGQLAWKLRNDPRVAVMERCNVRYLKLEDVTDKILFFSIDVSFISVKHVFPVISVLTDDRAEGICLVKPQFEAGRNKVGKKGVVRDPAIHAETICLVSGYAAKNGFGSLGIECSPIKGPEGNIEFLLYIKKCDEPALITEEQAREIALRAQREVSPQY